MYVIGSRLTDPSQFAYLQLGTLVTTIIRKLELRLAGPVPSPDYHVSNFVYSTQKQRFDLIRPRP
jgi:hypothetical protein